MNLRRLTEFAAYAVGFALTSSAQEARITIDAGKTLFRLSELMIGANMEDLHYQMVGGFDSQLIHGESFFEPSPTQLAAKSGLVAGFANCGGTVTFNNGELGLSRGTRLTSTTQASAANIELNTRSGAGLAICVSPNNSDNKWEWYSGYTAEVFSNRVVLTKAERANKHRELASAPVTASGEWAKLALRIDGDVISVCLNDKEVIRHQDEYPLPPAFWAIVARGAASFRGPFEPNPLLKTPGDAISLRWAKVQTGTATGSFALETTGTWFTNSPSQTITFTGGDGELGIDNAGLKRWGINLVADKPYEGFLRAKAAQPTEFWVSLRNANGTVVAEDKLVANGNFQRLAFTLTPSASDEHGRFAITLKKSGTVTFGYAFLQPGAWGRYNGLPVRKDLAEALLAQGIRVLRFNGGMIEVPGYRWRNMRGPRDQRPPYDGFYDRYCSSGFGPAEVVAFSKAAGLPVVPALNIDETPEDVADFVATCRPQFYQVANETRFDAKYVEKFKRIAAAVWNVAPAITLITTSTRGAVKDDDTEAAAHKKLALHLELAEFACQHGKPIVFDSHSFNGAAAVQGIASFARWLQRLAPDPKLVSVGILEFNAGAFDFQRGLNHALEMNAAHRAGDVIRAVGMPNVSQPWGVYQTDWKAVLWTQGNIYYTPSRVWFQPAYYVDQMIARHWAPNVIAFTTTAPEKTLDVIATTSDDQKNVVLRVVNASETPVKTEITLKGYTPRRVTAQIEELTGELPAFNTLDQPEKIKPRQFDWTHSLRNGNSTYIFPPHSFSIIRVE